MTNIRQEGITDADARGNNDYQNPQQNQFKESLNMDYNKKTMNGYDRLTKNPIIVTEQDLLEENFVYSINGHKYINKEMRLEKLKRSNNQTEKEFKKYLHDMNELFNCYKEAINFGVVYGSSCEFYEFHDFRANMHERNGEYYKAISDYNYAIKDLYHIPQGYISKGRVLLYCGRTVRALKNFDMALRIASAEDLLILSGEDGVVEDIKDCYGYIKCLIKKYLKLNPEAESKRELKRWLALTRVRLGKKIDSLLFKQRKRRNIENPKS
jgi:tetratricopeptide (TPR) repeat protein